MFCTKCGAQIPDGSQFCPNCGNTLSGPQAAPAAPAPKAKKPVTKRWWFWVIVVFLALSAIGAITGGGKKDTATTASNVPAQKTAAPTPEPTPTEDVKALALEADTTIYNLVIAAGTEYDTFIAYFQEAASDLDLYNAAKELKSSASNYSYMISQAGGPNIAEFRDYEQYASTYAYLIGEVAKKTMEYVDNPITSKLSAIQDAMADVTNWVPSLVASRMKALSACGFTDDEISEILGN